MNRTANVTRKTAETNIRVAINLDGTGQAKLDSGIGFLDHMLDQIARHGLIDLDIAFVARDGTVLEIRTMTAGDTETTRSVTKQARFAVEMRAGWFRDFGVKPGDRVNLDDLRSAVKARGYDVKKFLP